MAKKKKEEKVIGDPNLDKEKALKLALTALEKKCGEGSIVQGNKSDFPQIERIPSGSINLDRALNGGYAKGRMVELFGSEASGKTTCALHAIANCQQDGGQCAFVDAEHALDVEYAEALDVSIEDLLISQPNNGEQALDIVDGLVRSNAVDLIVIDSVAALIPQSELEGEMIDQQMGLHGKLMSKAMRMLTGIANKTNTCLIFINQTRSSMGMGGNQTTGGKALKYFSSQRVDIRRIGNIGPKEQEPIAIRTRAKVVKNKVGFPFRIAEFDIKFGAGIDWAKELIEMGLEKELITKSGIWLSYGEVSLGQGSNNASNFLRENKELAEEIRGKILGEE